MAVVSSQRYILPTLQSNFNYAINEILKRMNTVGIAETWKAIETLYKILPPTIKSEVKADYMNILKRLKFETNDTSVDFLAMVEANNVYCLILEELASPFFEKMYALLYEGGYLEKKPRKVPTSVEPGIGLTQ